MTARERADSFASRVTSDRVFASIDRSAFSSRDPSALDSIRVRRRGRATREAAGEEKNGAISSDAGEQHHALYAAGARLR